jgi:hypothetical protein
MNSIKFLFFLFFFLSANLVFSQKKSPFESKKNTVFVGKVLSKPWSKTGQSYCAQGSDYLVLKLNGKGREIVLENQSGENLEGFVNQNVKITGYLHKKVIKADPDVISQRPVGSDGNEDYSCEVLVLTKITLQPE